MFDLKLYYSTGNSFGSHDTTDFLDLPCEDINIAKENQKRIKEHYSFFKEKNGYFSKMKEIQYPDFYINKFERYDIDGIKLLKDDGTEHFMFSPFWIGYFERLQRVEIVVLEDDDGYL